MRKIPEDYHIHTSWQARAPCTMTPLRLIQQDSVTSNLPVTREIPSYFYMNLPIALDFIPMAEDL